MLFLFFSSHIKSVELSSQCIRNIRVDISSAGDLEKNALSLAIAVKIEHVSKALGAEACILFKFNIHFDLKVAPAESGEQERCLTDLYLVWFKCRVQVIGD